MAGIGSGAGAVGIAAAVSNRWFAERTRLAMGLLTAANAAGQLLFLPLLAGLADRFGWQGVAIGVTLATGVALPMLAILLPESPASVGLGAYGASDIWQAPPRRGNPIAVAFHVLAGGARSFDFRLLVVSFAICGFSTNALINPHLIADCADHGIPDIRGAGVLAVIGAFSLIGWPAGWPASAPRCWCCASRTASWRLRPPSSPGRRHFSASSDGAVGRHPCGRRVRMLTATRHSGADT